MNKEQKEKYDALIEDGNIKEAIDAYISLENNIDYALDKFEEAYQGEFASDEEFAKDIANNTGSIDFKNMPWPQYCIDWEYAAQELMMDYQQENEYYFRSL